MIFVFGSNLSGIHGAGAAKTALQRHGAVIGIGEGHQGNSYALPTKGINITYMPLSEVKPHVDTFLEYARNAHPQGFQVTRVGCGLAGFRDDQIAPLFINAPENCFFDTAWKPYLGFAPREYWGHY